MSIFDSLLQLQLEIKEEAELVVKYGRMFEKQIRRTNTDLAKLAIEEHLRYRSDFEFFKFEDERQNYEDELHNL